MPCGGVAARCAPANAGARAGRRGGNVKGVVFCIHVVSGCGRVWKSSGLAPKLRHAALVPGLPLRDAECPCVLLVRTK